MRRFYFVLKVCLNPVTTLVKKSRLSVDTFTCIIHARITFNTCMINVFPYIRVERPPTRTYKKGECEVCITSVFVEEKFVTSSPYDI